MCLVTFDGDFKVVVLHANRDFACLRPFLDSMWPTNSCSCLGPDQENRAGNNLRTDPRMEARQKEVRKASSEAEHGSRQLVGQLSSTRVKPSFFVLLQTPSGLLRPPR